MKMFFVFVICCLLLCGVHVSPLNVFDLEYVFGDAEVEVFIEEYNQNLSMIKNGTGGIVNIKLSEFDEIHKNNSVLGYTIKLKDIEYDVAQKMDAVFCFESDFGVYGFVPNLHSPVIVEGNICNVQILKVGSDVLIGIPILLGGY